MMQERGEEGQCPSIGGYVLDLERGAVQPVL